MEQTLSLAADDDRFSCSFDRFSNTPDSISETSNFEISIEFNVNDFNVFSSSLSLVQT